MTSICFYYNDKPQQCYLATITYKNREQAQEVCNAINRGEIAYIYNNKDCAVEHNATYFVDECDPEIFRD